MLLDGHLRPSRIDFESPLCFVVGMHVGFGWNKTPLLCTSSSSTSLADPFCTPTCCSSPPSMPGFHVDLVVEGPAVSSRAPRSRVSLRTGVERERGAGSNPKETGLKGRRTRIHPFGRTSANPRIRGAMAAAMAAARARREGTWPPGPREGSEDEARRFLGGQRARADPQGAMAKEKHLAMQVSALQMRAENLASALLEMREQRDEYLRELCDVKKQAQEETEVSTDASARVEAAVERALGRRNGTIRLHGGWSTAMQRAKEDVARKTEALERSWARLLVASAVEATECAEAANTIVQRTIRKAVENERKAIERERSMAVHNVVYRSMYSVLGQEAAVTISHRAVQSAILKDRRRRERHEEIWRKEAGRAAKQIASTAIGKEVWACPVRQCADNAVWRVVADHRTPEVVERIIANVLKRDTLECRLAARKIADRIFRDVLWGAQVDKYAPLVAHQAVKAVVMKDKRECLSASRTIAGTSISNATWNAEAEIASFYLASRACNGAIELELQACSSLSRTITATAIQHAIWNCPVRRLVLGALDSALCWEAAAIITETARIMALNHCPVRKIAISACEAPVIREKAALMSNQLINQAVEADSRECAQYARALAKGTISKLVQRERVEREKARAAREAARKEKHKREQQAAAARQQREAQLRRAGVYGKGKVARASGVVPERRSSGGKGSHLVRNISAAIGVGAGTAAMVLTKVVRANQPKALQMHCKSFRVLKQDEELVRARKRTLDEVLSEEFGL